MFRSRSPKIPAVDALEADKRVRDGALLIDVREQPEWDESRIPGAQLKPMSQVDSWYRDLPAEGEIILYCRSGARSGRLVHALMDQAGMTNVINMSGGIIAWAEEGLPVDE